MTGVPATAVRSTRFPLVVVALAASVLLAGLGGLATFGQSPSARLAVPSNEAAGPTGVITYEIGKDQVVSVTAAGRRLLAARSVAPRPTRSDERWVSPDGRTTVSAERTESGVFLTSSGSAPGMQAWIAGPDSPALVDGGKGPAAAVKGVPLVVSWSPDSEVVAYGSLTGEPFFLNVASPAHLDSARGFSLSGGYVGELTWSPNGRYLGISTYTMDRKHHTTFIFDRETNSVTRLIDGCHINWSPESQYVVVHRDPEPEPGTWVVAVDGSQRYALSDDPTSFPQAWEAS